MKAERQYKESPSRTTQSKGRNCNFVDKRSECLIQARMINKIEQGCMPFNVILQKNNAFDTKEFAEGGSEMDPERFIQRKSVTEQNMKESSLNKTIQLSVLAENPLAIKEEEYFIGTSGQTIKYTNLCGGCMAVTVFFSDGGGGGAHLVMEEQGSGQWTTFYDAISDKEIAQIHLNCDSWEGDEDWRVKVGESSPKSTLQLVMTDGIVLENLATAGWKCDKTSIKAWFNTKLGKDPLFGDGGTPEYTFP